MEVRFSAPPLGPAAGCRVFIPSDPRSFDLSDLHRFGNTVLPIVPHLSIYPDKGEEHERILQTEVWGSLLRQKFNPDQDYVSLMGDPLISATVMFVLGHTLDRVVLLRYDGQSRAYWPFTLNWETHRGAHCGTADKAGKRWQDKPKGGKFDETTYG